MRHLPSDLRNRFARVVQEARRLAEEVAPNALRTLSVDRAEPLNPISLAEKALRREPRGQRQVPIWRTMVNNHMRNCIPW